MGSMRGAIYGLAAIAIASFALLIIPQFFTSISLGEPLHTIVTWVFWVSFVGLLVALYLGYRNTPGSDEIQIEGPGFARFLFNNRAAGLFWLPIRVFVGVSFLNAGLHKLADPGWTQGGASLLAYWERAVTIPESGSPPITYDWYRDFIQMLININAESWFAWLVLLGEIAIGLGLILGVLTGIAAFFGALMNMSFLLAGSSSTNPVLFTFGIGLMLAWKVAGYYGLDRYLLPRLGTPWHRGRWTGGGPPADKAAGTVAET
jgi:thiosulfate dehydrogenase [quinone] large subunit